MNNIFEMKAVDSNYVSETASVFTGVGKNTFCIPVSHKTRLVLPLETPPLPDYREIKSRLCSMPSIWSMCFALFSDLPLWLIQFYSLHKSS